MNNSPIQDNKVTSTTYPRIASYTSNQTSQTSNGPTQVTHITSTTKYHYAETIAGLNQLIDGVFEEIGSNEINSITTS